MYFKSGQISVSPFDDLLKFSIEISGGLRVNKGFPGGAVVRNPPASAGDTGSSPGPGRSHMPRSN